jgi:hypothetical protein
MIFIRFCFVLVLVWTEVCHDCAANEDMSCFYDHHCVGSRGVFGWHEDQWLRSRCIMFGNHTCYRLVVPLSIFQLFPYYDIFLPSLFLFPSFSSRSLFNYYF